MGWACGPYGWGEGVFRVLVGKPEGKRPLGRPRRRGMDNIRMDLQEVRCVFIDWIGLTQDRDWWRTLVSAVMNLRVPWNAGNFLTTCKPVSFSRRTLYHGVSKYNAYYTTLSCWQIGFRCELADWKFNIMKSLSQVDKRFMLNVDMSKMHCRLRFALLNCEAVYAYACYEVWHLNDIWGLCE